MDEEMPQSPGFSIPGGDFLRRWGLLIVIGLAVFVISYILVGRKNSSNSNNMLPGQSTQNGANGQPLTEYVPTTGDQYININKTYNDQEPAPDPQSTTASAPSRVIRDPGSVYKGPSGPGYMTPGVAGAPSLGSLRPNSVGLPSPNSQLRVVVDHTGTATATINQPMELSAIASATGTTPHALYTANAPVIDHFAAQQGNYAKGSPLAATLNNTQLVIPNHGRIA